jgi:hypothetical protein
MNSWILLMKDSPAWSYSLRHVLEIEIEVIPITPKG